MTYRAFVVFLVAAVGLPAQHKSMNRHAAADATESSGAYIEDATGNAFGYPLPLLAASERRAFAVGNAIFRANWVAAPASTKGLDGLGPLFNARSCSSCHLRDGRSRPPEAQEPDRFGLLLRIGVRDSHGPDLPHPVYGTQIQDQAIAGVLPEAKPEIEWVRTTGQYGDGEPFELLSPVYRLQQLGHGELSDGVVLGGRTAPQMIGLGLLEAIPLAALLQVADPEDRDGDGVSGRLHVLPGTGGQIGRFGWKATQPTVEAQTVGALVHDMGITSPLAPVEVLTDSQRELLGWRDEQVPDIDAQKLARLVFYSRTLAVPAPRDQKDPDVIRGRQLFHEYGCAACHIPEWITGPVDFHPAFGGRVITPYTDLLLHDLGEGLADQKRDGDAEPAEWRTAPLWGIGLIPVVNDHQRYLHDGRARGLAEAVLWHGGEALPARERFRLAARAQRQQLLAFLRSL